jgi:hypothetical protein
MTDDTRDAGVSAVTHFGVDGGAADGSRPSDGPSGASAASGSSPTEENAYV